MKVLFLGDSPTVSTGFAACTRAACDALYLDSHEVSILGVNEGGDSPATRNFGYDIYSCLNMTDSGRDMMGVTRLPRLIDRLKPDVVTLLTDPWNVRGYFLGCEKYGLKRDELPPFIGWLAVDAINQAGDELNNLAAVFTWTRFGAEELRAGGCKVPIQIVPLGCDPIHFEPRDQRLARIEIIGNLPNVPLDSFIIGAVGRNQTRKRLDLTIRYFRDFIHHYEIDDAYLLLHVAPTGEQGIDIPRIAKYYDIESRVLLRKPHIGVGDNLRTLRNVYNSMDVYVTTSQGEGWGLPALEAMACGIPCVLPDFAAFNSRDGWVTTGVAELVPCSSTAPTAPMNGACYTIGGIPDEAPFVEALYRLYNAPKHRAALGQQGRRLAERLTWQACGRRFVTALESVMGGLPATAPAPLATSSQIEPVGRVVASG